MSGREELPSTLRRSTDEAQATWIAAHDAAIGQYGEGERAHRVAFAALKHSFEKVGDHWERKEGGRRGPSDEHSAQPGGTAGESFGGVDANASKDHLMELAKRLGVRNRWSMTKPELVAALRKANDRATAHARDADSQRSRAT